MTPAQIARRKFKATLPARYRPALVCNGGPWGNVHAARPFSGHGHRAETRPGRDAPCGLAYCLPNRTGIVGSHGHLAGTAGIGNSVTA